MANQVTWTLSEGENKQSVLIHVGDTVRVPLQTHRARESSRQNQAGSER